MNDSRTKKAAIIIVVIIGCLFFAWNRPRHKSAEASTESKSYPADWLALDLPQIPDSEIYSALGNKNQGMEVVLISDKPIDKAAEYYEQELYDRYFEYYAPSREDDDRWSNEFTSDQMEVTVDIQRYAGGEDRSTITLRMSPQVEPTGPTAGLAKAINID